LLRREKAAVSASCDQVDGRAEKAAEDDAEAKGEEPRKLDETNFDADLRPRVGLPAVAVACSLQLVSQEELRQPVGDPPMSLPELLPPGTPSTDYWKTLERLAERLAAGGQGEQRSRQVCEEVGAQCWTTAALLVLGKELLWEHAPQLANWDTAEDIALALGPDLDTLYRQRCDDGNAQAGEGQRRAACDIDWLKPAHEQTCESLCRSGAITYRLAARHADAEARLDAAFNLVVATELCSGLQDLWSARAEEVLTWESPCLEGLEARRARALELLRQGMP
jgi:hypothetical protein